jgi:hypothetical protein
MILVADGDSLTTDNFGTCWLSQFPDLPGLTKVNVAANGRTLANIRANLQTRVIAPYYDPAEVCVFSCWAGINDLNNGRTAVQVFDDMMAIHAAVTDAGFVHWPWLPMFSGVLTGPEEAQRLAYCDLMIAAGFPTLIDPRDVIPNPFDPPYWDGPGDLTHPTTEGQALLVPLVLTEYEELNIMGTLSTYARTALVNHARNKGSYSPAANHYCAAFVAGAEVSGNGYARAALANDKTTWGDAGSRAIANDVAFEFPDATASWGTIDEIRIYDASSGGNELARHTLAVTVPISDSTGPLTVPIGAIDITFAAGGFTNTVVHELLDLMFGATANAPRATVYGTYFNGDPQGAGAETSAARTAITQATAWNAAVAGLAKTAAAIALADEADADYYAEFTAAAAGTLLFSAALPASFTPPVGGSIPAGGLRTSLT